LINKHLTTNYQQLSKIKLLIFKNGKGGPYFYLLIHNRSKGTNNLTIKTKTPLTLPYIDISELTITCGGVRN
jgi:hypothetical protein